MSSSVIEYISYASTTHIIVRVLGIISFLYVFFAKPIKKNNSSTILITLLLGLILLIRLSGQPIGWGTACDRENYANRVMSSDNILEHADPVFSMFSQFIYQYTDIEIYFAVIAFIYLTLYIITAGRLVGNRQVWMFIVIMLSFGFLSYGYNTIRSGLAYSLLLFAISLKDKKIPMAVFLVLAACMHKSMLIPISMFLCAMFYPKTKTFFILWLLSIPLSFFGGSFFNNLFSTFSSDSRTEYLTSANDDYNIGFRIDFILYSLIPILVGYYYIFKRGFRSSIYTCIYNTYLLTNIFWILVIRSNFSDRFAYLSWFLIPILLAYPLLKQPVVVRNPNNWLAAIIAGETLFSFLF